MPQPWKVLSTTTTYRDQWLKLRTDRCLAPSGHVLEAYHVIEFPDWVNVMAITPDNKIILVREYRHGAGKILMGLPSGTAEADEGDPEKTTRRELQEETGYTGGKYFYLGSYYANPATQSNKVASYLAVGVMPGGVTNPDPGEDIEVLSEDFIPFMKKIWARDIDFQGLHLAALHLGVGRILGSSADEGELHALRRKLLR